MPRLALFFIAALLLALPTTARAADVCCLCQRTGDERATCITAPEESGQQFDAVTRTFQPVSTAEACSGAWVNGKGLNGWTCSQEIDSARCVPTSEENGLCPQGPFAAENVPQSTQTTSPATIGTSDAPPTPAIIPNLNVPIPGFEFEPPNEGENSLLAQYLAATYRYGISITAVAATIMFVWGAFMYLVGSGLGSIQRGKTIMQEAVLGMILVFGAVAILRVLNPDLITLRSLTVTPIPSYSDIEPSGSTSVITPTAGASLSNFVAPQAICRAESCSTYCNGCSPKNPLPSAPWIPDANQLVTITASEGLETRKGQRLRIEALNALQQAAQFAARAPGGPYTIRVADSYRPLSGQMYAVCQQLCGRTTKKFAPPGASMHGTGLAVDVTLARNGKPLVTVQDPLSDQAKYIQKEDADLLQKFMADAGFVRYCPEVWHFEFGIQETNEKKKQCPWPPPPPR